MHKCARARSSEWSYPLLHMFFLSDSVSDFFFPLANFENGKGLKHIWMYLLLTIWAAEGNRSSEQLYLKHSFITRFTSGFFKRKMSLLGKKVWISSEMTTINHVQGCCSHESETIFVLTCTSLSFHMTCHQCLLCLRSNCTMKVSRNSPLILILHSTKNCLSLWIKHIRRKITFYNQLWRPPTPDCLL